MLFKSNILALIGGGQDPLYPRNKVMLWDDYKAKCFAELEFRSEVLNVRLRRDKIVVVLQKMVYVYNFADLALLNKHDTFVNPLGLCALCADHNNTVLACPAIKPGHVRLDLFDINKSHVIAAHSGELTQLVLNLEGTLLATASDKGTLIRVWDTVTGAKVREFRRGTTAATIYSIAFSRNSNYIIVGSDKGTVHVYALYDKNSAAAVAAAAAAAGGGAGGAAGAPGGSAAAAPAGNVSVAVADDGGGAGPAAAGGAAVPAGGDDDDLSDAVRNKHSRLSFMKDVLPGYFSSEWSFASFTVEIPDPSKKFYTAFGSDESTILVICTDGTYFKYLLRPDQARIVQVGDASFK
jgi:WD40 repeat protein